jgi:hypothetical protein
MSKILITGNGFDLNMGLKTSYKDFLKSYEFKRIKDASNDNGLLTYLSTVKIVEGWTGVEHELKKYIQKNLNIDSKKLEVEFIQLKEALTNYLFSIENYFRVKNRRDNNLKIHKPIAYELLIEENFSKIITFNYTNIFLDLGHFKYVYIHGSLEDNNIVFGVEDTAVKPEFYFLNKSAHHVYGAINLRDEIENIEEIHFFGCALGETDDTHFKPVFEYLTSRDSRNEIKHVKRKIVFYVYAKEGYRSLFNNLLRHTKNHVGELKVNNQVIFYDVSGDRLTEIDQNWLNKIGYK